MVEHVEESLMEGETGTEHSSNQQILLRQRDLERSQRGRDRLRFVFQSLRELEGHHLTDTSDVVTKQHTVPLVVLVAQFRHIQVDHRITLAEIYYLHILTVFSLCVQK